MTNVSIRRVSNEKKYKKKKIPITYMIPWWANSCMIVPWIYKSFMKHKFQTTSKHSRYPDLEYWMRIAILNNYHAGSIHKCGCIDIRPQARSSTRPDPGGDISRHPESRVKMQLEQSFCFAEFMSVITKAAAAAEIKSRPSRRIVLRAGEWGRTNHPFHLSPCKSMTPSSEAQHRQPISKQHARFSN